jgi:uncharacterized protein YaiE (UPF0345 family)
MGITRYHITFLVVILLQRTVYADSNNVSAFGSRLVNEFPATVGVIAPGEYEFGTSTVEVMTVITGKLSALLPDSTK